MYSYKERIRAIELYIKYGCCATDTVRELGYPGEAMLKLWYREYREKGTIREKYVRQPKYSSDQVSAAVNHYLEHGRSLARTRRALGYPSRDVLREWINEFAPRRKKASAMGGSVIQFTQEQKRDAVIDLCSRKDSAAKVAKEHSSSRASLYKWKKALLGEESTGFMGHHDRSLLPDDKDALEAMLTELKEQVYRQQMELDILKKAAEIIKKDQGIGQKSLTNKEKSHLVDALRTTYPLNELLSMIGFPKSSYFYQRASQERADKYTDLRTKVKAVFSENSSRYGYRRIHAIIKSKSIRVSEKVIRRIMRDEMLIVPRKKRRKYNSYYGEVSPAADNIVARDFYADKPNAKWLTDLTEFHIPAGKVYLSPIIDCFDGLAVSWTIGTSPNAELANDMLDGAIGTLGNSDKPIVHSDRGGHYRWPGWITRMERAGLTRSMSKKGCSPDNAACEGFFGNLKNEMYYHRSWRGISIKQFMKELDGYLRWYNEKRIKMSLGAMSPIEYRRSCGILV